ncbi:MAG: DUF2199 domain-containing protein [Rhodoferax sp.]|nr:DUF2199 domain-containing protein [Rhodoferax sp.]
MAFEFTCSTCGKVHRGMPSFGTDAPLSYYAVPKEERELRCKLGTDDCVIDGESYFVRGCVEIPVHGESEPFSWSVWVSLSQASFKQWAALFHEDKRSHVGPFFGWLNSWMKPYPDTMNIKTHVHLRDGGVRPMVELEPTEHPLAVEQREGISVQRVAEIYSQMVHESEV